jgi:hypothetical protein
VDRLRHLPFEDLGFAKIDHHRSLRVGMPEVIYSAGKTPEQVAEIFARMALEGNVVLATRANLEKYEKVRSAVPDAKFHPLSGCIVLRRDSIKRGRGVIAVLSAGTSDLPVAIRPTAGCVRNSLFLISLRSTRYFPIWRRIVASVILLSAASNRALLSMIARVWSPSKGR